MANETENTPFIRAGEFALIWRDHGKHGVEGLTMEGPLTKHDLAGELDNVTSIDRVEGDDNGPRTFEDVSEDIVVHMLQHMSETAEFWAAVSENDWPRILSGNEGFVDFAQTYDPDADYGRDPYAEHRLTASQLGVGGR